MRARFISGRHLLVQARLSTSKCLRAAAAVSISIARYRSTIVLPAAVSSAPPPPLPPAAVSTTGVPSVRFRSSTSSQVRRYDMRKALPAAEMEPDRAISSSTATLPGPMRAPDARSSRMLSRSIGWEVPDLTLCLVITGAGKHDQRAKIN